MKCSRCKLDKGVQLMGRGNTKAKIMIVLDCPTDGCKRDNTFLSGDILQKMLYLCSKTGLKPKDLYFTSAVKCPVKKPSDIKDKSVNECQDHLFDEILHVKPKIIVAMGKSAHYAVTHQTSVKEFRGHFTKFEFDYQVELKGKAVDRNFTCDILPTFSPIGSMTKWENDIYIIHDLKKAKKALEKGLPKLVELPEFKVALSPEELDEMKADILASKATVIDFETTHLLFHKGDIINAGYCTNDNKIWITYISGFPKEAQKKFTDEEKARAEKINIFVRRHKNKIHQTLKEINGSKSVKKIGHNLKFDCKFALKHKIPIKNWFFDTILADSLIDENRFHDLNSCMEFRDINFGAYDTDLWKYVNKDHKNKKPYYFVPPQVLERYLAIDVYGDWLLYKKTIRELKKEPKLYKYMFEQQMPLAKELTTMEYIGHKIDKDKLCKAHEQLNKETEELLEKIRKHVKNPDFNPNSVEQLSAYMEEKGYPFEKYEVKRGAKGYSTAGAVMEKFATLKKWSKLPTLILRYRTVSKFNSKDVYGPITKTRKKATGLLPLLSDASFIHTNYNLWTPRTGRLSSTNPNCFSLDTEILTTKGWRQYNTISKEDDILCFNQETETLEKHKYLKYYLSEEKEHTMVSMVNQHMDAKVTDNHRMLYKNRKTHRLMIKEAKEHAKDYRVLHGAFYSGGTLSLDKNLIGLIIAIQADGHFHKDYLVENHTEQLVTFKFTKTRKRCRLSKILKALNYTFTSTTQASGKFYMSVKVPKGLLNKYIPNKSFSDSLLDLDGKSRSIFLAELSYWDGLYTRRNTLTVGSKEKENIDLIQILSTIHGYRSHLHYYTNSDGRSIWNLYNTNRNYSLTANHERVVTKEVCKVWCIETPTGAVVTRRNNKVLINGQCQNIPRDDDDTLPSIRNFFIPSHPDYVEWEADFISLEVAVAAWLSCDKLLLELLEKGTDMHSYNLINVGAKIGMIDENVTYDQFRKVLKFEPKDPDNLTDKDKELLKKQKDFKFKRFLTKSIVFGLNYGKEARTFAKDLERPIEEMEDFIEEYFILYKGVNKFREFIKKKALTTGILELKSGRKRRLTYAVDWINSKYGQKCKWKTNMLKSEIGRQAMNFPVQGSANDIYVKAKLKVIKELRKKKIKGGVRLTIHDGFVAEGRKKDLPMIEELCHKLMTTVLPLKSGGKITLAVDFEANAYWYGPSVKYKKCV